jgi:predicted CXXCH cytochrome family protein
VTSPAATYLLPLPAGVLATRLTMVSSGVETTVGSTPPIQDACLSCHDAVDAAGHAQLNTTADGVETCGVCHGEGAAFAVSALHAIDGTP